MASDTGGVKAFSIQGRLYRERERLTGMTDAERAWRKQWIKDQVLHNEPKVVPEMYKARYNIIRRAYWWPLDTAFKALEPFVGKSAATTARILTGRLSLVVATIYAGTYYFKYNANDWTRKGGWRMVPSRPACLPGSPGYPQASDRSSPGDYNNRNFKNAPI